MCRNNFTGNPSHPTHRRQPLAATGVGGGASDAARCWGGPEIHPVGVKRMAGNSPNCQVLENSRKDSQDVEFEGVPADYYKNLDLNSF